ncbi:hypothetical protein Tco_1400553 [Tanacetum coccineum]
MASESTSSQQSQQLIPSSKVNFRCVEGIIAFNNVVALLEHSNESYRPILSFLSNYCINKALTLQPLAMYMEYLKEFWYTAEVEEETKTITILLSWWDKPLSLTRESSNPAIWHTHLNGCCFSTSKGDPTSFQKPLAYEVPLTSHMLKVAKLSEEPEQSLIPPSGEVNADDTADKSLSRAFVLPITQLKAPTDLKTKKKRIPHSSKPTSPYKVKVILQKKQVVETQYAEVTVATATADPRVNSLVRWQRASKPGRFRPLKQLNVPVF